MTTTSSSTSPSAFQDDARRSTVGSFDAQREAIHLVDARLRVRQVQSFDDDHSGAEERVVRGVPRAVELFDGQVIDADHLYALIDEKLRAVSSEVRVVAIERLFRVP